MWVIKKIIHFFLFSFLIVSCANIVMPSGGKKDTSPPVLSNVTTENNTVNFTKKNIVFEFNENVVPNNWSENFSISPLTKEPVNFKIKNKTLTLDLDNKLEKNTTYSVNLDNCIKDLNEGNILENLRFSFSTGSYLDSLSIKGIVIDAFTLEPKANTHVFLQDFSDADSLSFIKKPKYVTKTNSNGEFLMTNLNNNDFKIFCIDGIDYAYHEGDLIGFYKSKVNASDSNKIELLMYNPINKLEEKKDTIDTKEIITKTKIVINCNVEEQLIIQLYKDKKLVKEASVSSAPYFIENIIPENYTLKIIVDKNKNRLWDSGNFSLKQLPEKVYIYNETISVRENWTVELDCFIN